MVKLLDIDRTATFAISNHNLPYLATANVAGAIDADFSDSSKLEIWNPFSASRRSEPVRSLEIDSKVYDLSWSADNALLVGGLENGALQFWNGESLINGSGSSSSSSSSNDPALHTATNHTSAVKSLAFNHARSNVLLSGSANSEIFIWDTNKLSSDPLTPTGEPYSAEKSAGKKSIEEVSSLSWNHIVSHIFASASNTGITSIWDLKSKRKVLNLSYTATTGNGNIRANLSSVAWHPTQSTKLVTTSDLDSLPVVLQWDLRFSKTPELIYGGPTEFNTNKQSSPGHSKGILSLDWLSQDSDFLLTSGKDSNTFLWDTKTGDKVASYPLHAQTSTINAIGTSSSSDWVFKSRFAGKNPEYFANATFDGKVIFQTLQDTSRNLPDEVESQKDTTKAASEKKETSETDFWNQISTEDGVNADEEAKEEIKPEVYIKKAPKWLSRPTSVSFAFGGRLVRIKTVVDENKNQSSVIEISTAKLNNDAENTKSAEKLLNVLSGDDEKVKQVIKESSSSDQKSFDWKLLDDLKSLNGDKKKLLEKYILPKEEKEEEPSSSKQKDEGEKNEEKNSAASQEDDAFFSNLAEESSATEADEAAAAAAAAANLKVFKPSGNFELFSSDDDNVVTELKKLILSGKFDKAIDLSLENDKVVEALIIALNSQNESLKQKVLGQFFENNITKKSDSLARLLYATSGSVATSVNGSEEFSQREDTINDLIENGSVENWKEIALGISTYVKDEQKFSQKITDLGNRVYESGSRDNAVLLYFIGGSLNSISAIWLKELEQNEKNIVNSGSEGKHESLLDIYYKLLDELIVKVLIFKKSLGIDGELPNTESYSKLIKLFLDYIKNVGDNSGNFELVGKLLSVLPSGLSDVELGKARIDKATAKAKAASAHASATAAKHSYGAATKGAKKYSSPSLKYGGGAATAVTSPIPIHNSFTAPAPAATGANQAFGIGIPNTPGGKKSTSRSRYVAPPTNNPTPFPGPPPAASAAASSAPAGNNPYAPVKNNGYTPAARSGTNSPYAPHASLASNNGPTAGFNNFTTSADGPLPPPPLSSSASTASRLSSSQNPSKGKKSGHEGWNDLPDIFADVTSKATKKKAAPVNVAPSFGAPGGPGAGAGGIGVGGPFSASNGAPSTSQPPGFSRNSSFTVSTPPPPPKASARTNSSALNSPRLAATNLTGGSHSSNSGNATPSVTQSKYAPPPQPAPQHHFGGSHQQQQQGPPQQFAPPSRVMSPAPVNPYAPPPPSQFTSFGPAASAGPGASGVAPPPPSSFGAPSPAITGPPPISGRGFSNQQSPSPVNPFGPSPAVLKSPTAAESIAQQAGAAQYGSSSGASTPATSGPPKSNNSAAAAAQDAQAPAKPKYPAGDRSHIPASSQPIFQILSSEIATVKPKIPARYAKKTHDTEKRLNILFDHLNNEDLLSEENVELLAQLANALSSKDFASAHDLHLQIATNFSSETGTWLIGVKRLIDMVEATDGM